MRSVRQYDADPRTCTTLPSAQRLGATDAVVRVDTAPLCGTDLHMLKGVAPVFTDVRTRGRDAVGTVIDGAAAKETAPLRRTGPWSPAPMTIGCSAERTAGRA